MTFWDLKYTSSEKVSTAYLPHDHDDNDHNYDDDNGNWWWWGWW
jgi:hypothetical protein